MKEFIQGPAWDWFKRNSTLDGGAENLDGRDFFIVPKDPAEPGYADLVSTLIRRFSESKVVATKVVDDYVFRKLSEGDFYWLIVARTDGLPVRLEDNAPFHFDQEELTFLQKLDFIAGGDIPAPSSIPSRLLLDALISKSPLFEADAVPYLPSVVSWRVSKDSPYHADPFEVACVRLALNLSVIDAPVRRFADTLVQLALVMPETRHDWLFDQLQFSLTSRRSEYLFLGLYQLLEFFFPLKGVVALKSALKYQGSYLELRAYCSEALGWNVNHHTGARAAVHLSTHAFADICLSTALPPDAAAEHVDRHKAEAIAKISELRHTLAHQSFAPRKPNLEGLAVKTEALLSLLIDAFGAYTRQHC